MQMVSLAVALTCVANPPDEAIAAFYKSTADDLGGYFPDGDTRVDDLAWFDEWCKGDSATTTLFCLGSIPIALCQVWWRPNDQTARLAYLVHKDYRKRGVGTFVIRHILTKCSHLPKIDARVNANNKASGATLRKCGFRAKRSF